MCYSGLRPLPHAGELNRLDAPRNFSYYESWPNEVFLTTPYRSFAIAYLGEGFSGLTTSTFVLDRGSLPVKRSSKRQIPTRSSRPIRRTNTFRATYCLGERATMHFMYCSALMWRVRT